MAVPNLLALGVLAAGLCACAATPSISPFAEAVRSEPGVVLATRPIVSVLSSAKSHAVDEQTYVAVIGRVLRPGETQLGISYTVRRDRDGVAVEIAQPAAPMLAAGTRVRIVYDDHVRLVEG